MAKKEASRKDGSSLEQAQYEYRKTIYFEGLKILENFSEAVIGRDPSSGGDPPPGQQYPVPWGPPVGVHIYVYGPPSGVHIYGPPIPPHIYGPPPPPPPVADGPPSLPHIYGIIQLVQVVLSLTPSPKPSK